jgi:hypothetical protein
MVNEVPDPLTDQIGPIYHADHRLASYPEGDKLSTGVFL